MMKHLTILMVAMLLTTGSIGAQTKATKDANKKARTTKVVTTAKDSARIADSLQNIVRNAEAGDPAAQNTIGMWYYKGEHFEQDYKKAYSWWTNAAAQLNIQAIGNIGLLYQYGRGVEADSVKALRQYTSSIRRGNKELLKEREATAEEGNCFDGVLCGVCYAEGYGTKRNAEKAIHYFEIAAKQNSPIALRELGYLYQRSADNSKAVESFKKAADAGDTFSAYQYAKIALSAKDTISDKKEAIVYLVKAAEAGIPQAQCDLGTFYYQGKYVTKDQATATQLFTKAAIKGWGLAQWNLALCYIDGNGVARDYDQALYWLGEASTKGYMAQFKKMCADEEKGWKAKPFMTYLKGMSLYFSDEKNIDGAYEEFKKIQKTVVEAQTMASVCLANKNYKKANAKKAAKDLAASADAGNMIAKFYLASLYESGNGVEKDTTKAAELYQASANGGYTVAQCYLGNLFFEGRIVEKSLTDAVRYYKMAEEQGQLTAAAAKNYAQCYEEGLGGLSVDTAKAEQLKKRDFTNHVIPMLKQVQ